ncbi:hypothetical protein ACFE04_028187 [Oxalis oulophora]
MGAEKKGGGGGGVRVSEDELARQPLQAILLADSFATNFRPITLDRPKVLLPLVNVPMINYTLAWLESAGVKEVFVFCCAHSTQLIDYLNTSQWLSRPNFTVSTIQSHNSISAGDALRFIYERHVIHGDFLLISGDTVSNMSLTRALQDHKDRKKKDNDALMTMIVKRSKPSSVTHQSRFGNDELFMAIDPSTKQLLYYEDKADYSKGTLSLDKMFLTDRPSIGLHNDKEDCYIDICSPEVLSLFTDNFDYQHLRRHFVKGLLVDDIMGYKIFTHEIHSSYAARIDNFRSYDTISKDIIQRWTYPFVPDVNFCGHHVTKLERQGKYRASEVAVSQSAEIGPFTVIGNGTKIGNNSRVINSVIGEGCTIGSNVSIEGSYIWNNVTIEDGCELKHAIVCDGVIIKTGAVLEPGAVLSFKVVIGPKFVVPAYSKVSLHEQPSKQDSDDELEYAENSSGIVEFSSTNTYELNGDVTSEFFEVPHPATSEVGSGGAGYIWSICEEAFEEEWRHSVAPISADKIAELTKSLDDDLELSTQNCNALTNSGELKSDSNINDSEDEDSGDDYFEKEVEGTFLRAVEENIKQQDVILEINSLRLSYNMTATDCASALFYSMLKLALETPHSSASELFESAKKIITTWKGLLKFYLPEIDEEIEVILKFEEMCVESAKEFSAVFDKMLYFLYDKEIVKEEAVLRWADEKEGADESDKVFVKQSEEFIRWLREAPEEEEEEDEED